MTVSNGKSAAGVLTDFVDKCVANLEAGDYNEAKRKWDVDVTEALAALEEIMDKQVIGEDEPTDNFERVYPNPPLGKKLEYRATHSVRAMAINQTKADARKRLRRAFSKEAL